MVWYVISNAILQSLPEQKFWWQWQWDRQDSQSLEVLRSLWQLDGPPNKRRPKEVWCTTMDEKYGVAPKYLQTKLYHKDENYIYTYCGFTVEICQQTNKVVFCFDPSKPLNIRKLRLFRRPSCKSIHHINEFSKIWESLVLLKMSTANNLKGLILH